MKLSGRIEEFYRVRQAHDVIPLHEPELLKQDELLVTDCIRSGWVSSVGEYVTQAEGQLSSFVGSNGAVAVVNGTAALHLALRCVGVQRGDEVLVPSLTFVATSNAVHYCAATPNFVDVEKKQFGVCPFKLERYLSQIVEMRDGQATNRYTQQPIRALIFVHIFGNQGDVEAVTKVAHSYGIQVVEDCAESLGTYTSSGLHSGMVGDVGAFSFNGNKIITCGGGGMLISKHGDYIKRAKHLSTTAKVTSEGYFFHDEVGYNYRMPNLNAALLVSQLAQLSDRIKKKRCLYNQVKNEITEKSWQCQLVEPVNPNTSNYWLISLKVAADELNELLIELNHSGILARPLWELNHTLPMNLDCPKDDLSNSEQLVKKIVCLPSSAKLALL